MSAAAGGDLFAAPAGLHSLFFALLPDPASVAALGRARTALEATLPPQRGAGIPEARLHLTLHWLGEWSQLPPQAVAAARQAAGLVQGEAFTLRLDQADCFGHAEAIWVLRPSAPPAALSALHRDLAAALARQRFRLLGGPAFAPHVSLRRRATARFAARSLPPVEWPVDGFALVHSEREAGRTAYHLIDRWPLLQALR